tara:strand:+ start:1869 stop:3614 length:1746 start_codon:yes stop_codon:yes gene_type:complete
MFRLCDGGIEASPMRREAASYLGRGSFDPVLMLLATLPGIALAFWLYGMALDPRHVEWLLAEGDSLQHFSGWDMFRRDEWRWPLGAVPTLGYQVGSSIVYTDSIPLIAIPLKLLHAWLPDPMQYIAPVMMVNLALNGAVAAGLLRWLGVSRSVALAGSLLVISLPMVTMRGPGALGHEALASHWLILVAVWLMLVPRVSWGHALRWLALLLVAVLVHFYLFFMVGVLWTAWCLAGLWNNRREPYRVVMMFAGAVLTMLMVLVCMYTVGYFEFALTVEGETGFGLYSTEMLSFFNPGSAGLFFQDVHFEGASSLIEGWFSPVAGQYEGFAYAGMGVLGLWVMALAVWITGCYLPLNSGERLLFVPLLALFIFALSDQVVVGQWVVSLSYPAWMDVFTHKLRSSGRMAWPLLYGLLFAALLILARRMPVRCLWPLLLVVLLLQAWDVSHWQRYARYQISQLAPCMPVMRPFAWREEPAVVSMLEESSEIRLLPGDDWQRVKIISWLAARHDLASNVAYFARTNPGLLYAAASEQRAALEARRVEPSVLYALTDTSLIEIACQVEGVACLAVDGMTLALKSEQQ